ncbi:MAG TPA: hypothetical protein VFT31_17235 [Kribbella sp.]|nr:hypothetical protein [Kribbella sp.]
MTLLRKTLAIVAAALLSLAGVTLSIAGPPTAAAAGVDVPGGVAPPGGVVAPGGVVPPAGTWADDPPKPKKLFTIRDKRVDESSGLAKSQKYEGVWWTVNDSGDTARVFGVNSEGKVKAVLTFKAPVRDVEAIAVDRQGTIYIGDIGDNRSSRDFIAVYTIPEPDRLEDQQVKYHRYDFEYPDGAHNAETLLVQPETRRLYFVTKVKSGKAAFYSAPAEPSRAGVNRLTRMADAPSGITDGTFLPDGRRLVLRSYVDIATLSWGPKPKVQARAAVPLAQGESVAAGPSSSSVVVGSEGVNSVVYQVQVPTKKAGATASPSPNAATDGGNANHNLRWILVGAGAFALLIAFITFPAGRRERDDAMIEQQRVLDQDQRKRSTV